MARKMNRRVFFRRMSLGLIIPLGVLSFFSISKNRNQSLSQIISIPEDQVLNNTFFQGIFIRIQQNELIFLSTQCSHLGCEIHQINNGVLLCPCHGSKFDFGGQVIEGPASKSLKKLKFDYLASEKKYMVYKQS